MKGHTFTLIFLYVIHVISCEMFTSFHNLQQSVHAEKYLSQELKGFVQAQHARLVELERIADKLEEHSKHTVKDSETHLSNPINAYLYMKKLFGEWDRAVNLITNKESEGFLNEVHEKFGHILPGEVDVTGAAQALLRLQDTYKLSVEKIAKGDLLGVKESPNLTAGECFEVGRMAYNGGDHYHSIPWMSAALDILETETNKTADKALLMDYLSFSLYMQGNIEHALNMTNKWLELEPDHRRAQTNRIHYVKMLQEAREEYKRKGQPIPKAELKNEQVRQDYRGTEDFHLYEALCRGEDAVPNPEAHKLTCQFVTRNQPMFFLSPLKEETLNLKPWIAFYHDMLRDKDIEIIKALAIPKLHRSGVFSIAGMPEIDPYTNNRISKSAWLGYDEHPMLDRLEKKIHAMTGLDMETAEKMQVLNYGIGGHYEPHYDFARPTETNTFESWRGNRIATVIFYLNEVTAGGATVFPAAGARVWPQKGGCAFWYNLHRNGEGDYSTRHAACPVLTGIKWVCNKWIHERGQETLPTRQCTLKPNE